jgi:hypothetical protein
VTEKTTFLQVLGPKGVSVNAAEEGEYRRGEKRVVLVENGRKKSDLGDRILIVYYVQLYVIVCCRSIQVQVSIDFCSSFLWNEAMVGGLPGSRSTHSC